MRDCGIGQWVVREGQFCGKKWCIGEMISPLPQNFGQMRKHQVVGSIPRSQSNLCTENNASTGHKWEATIVETNKHGRDKRGLISKDIQDQMDFQFWNQGRVHLDCALPINLFPSYPAVQYRTGWKPSKWLARATPQGHSLHHTDWSPSRTFQTV